MIRSINNKTPKIDESAFVSEAAYIIGDVEIGKNSGVWPGAVIRADFAGIKIGCNTMVEDNCVLHTGVPMDIGDYVIIGHGVVVHGEKIGNNNLIGNNATILENSQIGDFCIIGAGSLVSAGMKIPDKSFLVGVPGKIMGQISSEHLQWLQKGSQSYLELLRLYKREGL